MIDHDRIVFDQLESTLHEQGLGAALDLLIDSYRREKQYPHLFDALSMQARHRLGLSLSTADPVPEDKRRAYDDALVGAARQTGQLFLDDGHLARAWPYFRAIGEPAVIEKAIESYNPAEDADAVIEIALGERVHPRKGFELVLSQHGTCRAITCFEQVPEGEPRRYALALLVDTLYRELSENLKRTIERRENASPSATSVRELIHNRDWLFGEYDYYVDTSHLISVLRYSTETNDSAVLAKAVELAEYGQHLAAMFNNPGEPPFDDIYRDHEIYLHALLGENVEAAAQHFLRKIDQLDFEVTGSYPVQVVVRMLCRFGRFSQAADLFEKHLTDVDPMYLTCPSLTDLVRLAKDWDRLQSLARRRNDLLTWLSARSELQS